ncbi:hypothetical protein NNC19_04950 [Clostridium sp. SHJSY1]|uniref:hypothetical protein n=1 Tax=Clostridium sp. SHJSY1 TaxID=2942483 RepID=UPI00287671DB|nr:hypothetical protein [Clostridium sp. SHJSY1]MDS0525020.1 hypothetical protein [Clostridium sp. SHJSY1]
MKKLIVMLSVLIISIGLVLTGCGKTKIDPPEVTAEAFYDIYVLGDSTKIEKLGVEKSEYESIVETERNAIISAIKNNFTIGGFTISNDQLNRIADAELAALKKLTPKIETTSTSKETASVKIATTYADVVTADQKAANDALAEVKAMGLTSESEARTKFVEIYVNKIVENVNAIEPSADTKEKTFTFKIEKFNVGGKAKDIWIPSDMTSFGTDLGKMITGQN